MKYFSHKQRLHRFEALLYDLANVLVFKSHVFAEFSRISFGWVGKGSFMVIKSCLECGFGKTNVRFLWLAVIRCNCSLVHNRVS